MMAITYGKLGGVILHLSTEEIIDKLINSVSTMVEVQSIGISGSKSPLPKAGEGDIDIFIYCDSIPEVQKRKSIINQMENLFQDAKINAFEGGHWGVGDFGAVNGVEVWLMYFTLDKAIDEVEAILNGEYPDKLDNYYYPVGRCAMLKNINILFDKKGFLLSLKNRLKEYPEKLSETIGKYHLDALEDKEDLERAVGRGDVLFYHFALDIAMDHFLQALFSINKTFFPSRKRSLSFIERFRIKPDNCNERLLEIIKLGGYPEGIHESYSLLNDLVNELKLLYS